MTNRGGRRERAIVDRPLKEFKTYCNITKIYTVVHSGDGYCGPRLQSKASYQYIPDRSK